MKRGFAAVILFAGCVLTASWAAGQKATQEVAFADVPVVDTMCSVKAAADPDAHTRACALQCQNSGFGVLTGDKEFLKLDEAGNKQVRELLRTSSQEKKLRVAVTGTRRGDTLEVKTIRLI